jgi:hypothetical protein
VEEEYFTLAMIGLRHYAPDVEVHFGQEHAHRSGASLYDRCLDGFCFQLTGRGMVDPLGPTAFAPGRQRSIRTFNKTATAKPTKISLPFPYLIHLESFFNEPSIQYI